MQQAYLLSREIERGLESASGMLLNLELWCLEVANESIGICDLLSNVYTVNNINSEIRVAWESICGEKAKGVRRAALPRQQLVVSSLNSLWKPNHSQTNTQRRATVPAYGLTRFRFCTANRQLSAQDNLTVSGIITTGKSPVLTPTNESAVRAPCQNCDGDGDGEVA